MQPNEHGPEQILEAYRKALEQTQDELNTDLAQEALSKVPKGVRLNTTVERTKDQSIIMKIHYRGEVLAARRLKLNITFDVETMEIENGYIQE